MLKSIHLLPEISVTDCDFSAWLTPEQIRDGALELISRTVRAYLDPGCSEFTTGLLADAAAQVLENTKEAMRGNPAAREKLLNASALAGAAYGSIVDTVVPDQPWFPTNEERTAGDNDIRCADLAERLGFHDCGAFFAFCEALRML